MLTAFFQTCEPPAALLDALDADAAQKLASIRLDKKRLKLAAQTSPPPASWYDEDARCW